MAFSIIVRGEKVRERDTREECIEIAVRQGWGRIDGEGNFILHPGNELIETGATPETSKN